MVKGFLGRQLAAGGAGLEGWGVANREKVAHANAVGIKTSDLIKLGLKVLPGGVVADTGPRGLEGRMRRGGREKRESSRFPAFLSAAGH